MPRVLSLIPLGLFAVGLVQASPLQSAPRSYAAVARSVERLAAHELAAKQIPAISVALVEDQRIVWSKGFGFADPQRKVGAAPDTVYRVGSVSKLFTDLAVMQLAVRVVDAKTGRPLPAL